MKKADAAPVHSEGPGFKRMKKNLGSKKAEELRQEVLAEQAAVIPPKPTTEEPVMEKATKKAARAKTRTAVKEKSKTAIALELLRKGATRQQIVEATQWPTINLKPIAKRHGLKLTVKDGTYHAA